MRSFTHPSDASRVLYYFDQISRIPHGSGNTDRITDYLSRFAEAHGLAYRRDESNNLIIRKDGTEGYETHPTVILQGHTDMVAVKTADCPLDLEREGLYLVREGDILRAEGTSLGADDGIAVAYALAILESNDIPHPPLEVLLTADEEIGLVGAEALDTKDLLGRTLINIDAGGEGVFTVGCAGGMRVDYTLPLSKPKEDAPCVEISLSGLRGGHSGMMIGKGRKNACKLLISILHALAAEEATPLRIGMLTGGDADNAIPRFAACAVPLSLSEKAARVARHLTEQHRADEPSLTVTVTPIAERVPIYSEEDTELILSLLDAFPTDATEMSRDFPSLVETSLNLAMLRFDGQSAAFTASLRSLKDREREALFSRVGSLVRSYGGTAAVRAPYPAWEYRSDSRLLRVMTDAYRDLTGKEPEVTVLHAGLECGILAKKLSGLDCIAIGPDTGDLHTPREWLSLPSAERTYALLKETLKRL